MSKYVHWYDEHRPRYGCEKILPEDNLCPICRRLSIAHRGRPLYIPSAQCLQRTRHNVSRVVIYICGSCYNKYHDTNCTLVNELLDLHEAYESQKEYMKRKHPRRVIASVTSHVPIAGYVKSIPSTDNCPVCEKARLSDGIKPLYIPPLRKMTNMDDLRCYYVCPNCYIRYYQDATSFDKIRRAEKCRLDQKTR